MSINYRQLRERLRIEEVLKWMAWEPSWRNGGQLRGRCPFCAAPLSGNPHTTGISEQRHFSVNTERNIYRCFKCQSSGNALELWAHYRRLPLYHASQEIQNRLDQNTQPKKQT
jgi:hypothetical protein